MMFRLVEMWRCECWRVPVRAKTRVTYSGSRRGCVGCVGWIEWVRREGMRQERGRRCGCRIRGGKRRGLL
jgi:hypothetical protein